MSLGRIIFYPNYFYYAGIARTTEPSLTGETYTCSGGETSGAIYDLIDSRRTNVVTTDSNGVGADFTVDVDLIGNITNADFAILDNHNLTTADGDIRIQHGGSDVDISYAYSGTLGEQLTNESIYISSNWVATPEDGVILIYPFDSNITDNNWEVNIRDNSANNFNADVTMGELAIGVSCSPSFSPERTVVETKAYQGIDIRTTNAGQKYGFKRYGKQQIWKLEWEYLSSTDVTNIETMFDVVEGSMYPFWIDLGETSSPTLYFVRFLQDRLDFKKKTADCYGLQIMIEEEL